MDEKELATKILTIFPNITVHVSRKNNNLRMHFKAEEHNYVPSKWILHNTLGYPLEKIIVEFKNYDDGILPPCPGKLFTLKDAYNDLK